VPVLTRGENTRVMGVHVGTKGEPLGSQGSQVRFAPTSENETEKARGNLGRCINFKLLGGKLKKKNDRKKPKIPAQAPGQNGHHGPVAKKVEKKKKKKAPDGVSPAGILKKRLPPCGKIGGWKIGYCRGEKVSSWLTGGRGTGVESRNYWKVRILHA